MSVRHYKFNHHASISAVARELDPEISRMAQKYGLAVERGQQGSFRLRRPGASLTFNITPTDLQVTVDLAWFAGRYHRKIGDGLRAGLPGLLRRCEASGSAGRA